MLFREKLNGKEYSTKDARSFETWANTGWNEKSYFVFVIKNKKENIIGAIDIKSNEPNFGEIGYWMNKHYPGYMTNALAGLIKIARKAGYNTLLGYTKLKNDKSKGVLARNGFIHVGQEKQDSGVVRDKFELSLKT